MGRRPSARTPARLLRTRPTRHRVTLEIVLVSLFLTLTPGKAWAAPPANDDFDSAVVVPSLPFSDVTMTTEATTASDDPDCYGKYRTVWYSWTPDVDVYIKADTIGSSFDTTASAYTGSRGALTQIACNTNVSASPIEFFALGGETYHFMLGSLSEAGGDLTFSIEGFVPPDNDDFDDATVITSLPYSDSIDTTNATSAVDDPDCPPGGNGHSVWYAFTPGEDVRVWADAVASEFSTTLSSYSGTRDALNELACSTGQHSKIEFDATAGSTYHFMVASYGTHPGGNITFSVEALVAPANDDSNNAIFITSLPFSDSRDARGATTAPGDPSDCGNSHSVWYAFTPHEDMRMRISTTGTDYAAEMSVYTGTTDSLVLVECVRYPYTLRDIQATGGTTYFFMVTTYGDGLAGNLEFSVERVQLPSELSLSVSKRQVEYNKSVTITAHLDVFAEAPDALVNIYKTPYGGSKTLVTSGGINESGDLSAPVTMKKKTTFVAEWAGDDGFLPDTSDTKVVLVRVITKTKLSGHYGTSGRYKLYHAGDDPKQTGTVIPNHAGKRLDFVAQAWVGGSWVTIATARPRIRANGSVSLRLIDPAPGYNYRARNGFDGDRDHLGDTSSWKYFRVTS